MTSGSMTSPAIIDPVRGQAKLATWCYGLAVLLIPVSAGSKFLLGIQGVTWIDPTLLLALASGLALMPAWGDYLAPPLRNLTFAAALLALLSFLSALSGLLIRPTADFYAAVREPLRLALVLCWLLVSAWFFRHKRLVVLRYALGAVLLALLSGVYLDLAALRLAPAPAATALYMQLYWLRQSVWFHGYPIPRMGGLFIEAPPFGLFMFSMLLVFAAARSSGLRLPWITRSKILALAGVSFSLAEQVLMGGGLVIALLAANKARRQPLLAWSALSVTALLLASLWLPAYLDHERHQDALSSININGNSFGERIFHFKYGVALLEEHPWATFFGIGPGRYGEYAADTGLFPASVTMQSSQPELLVEWGCAGLACWVALAASLLVYLWRRRGLAGLAWALGLMIADSFQANWKAEAVAFAIAALYALPPCDDVTVAAPVQEPITIYPGQVEGSLA